MKLRNVFECIFTCRFFQFQWFLGWASGCFVFCIFNTCSLSIPPLLVDSPEDSQWLSFGEAGGFSGFSPFIEMWGQGLSPDISKWPTLKTMPWTKPMVNFPGIEINMRKPPRVSKLLRKNSPLKKIAAARQKLNSWSLKQSLRTSERRLSH